MPKTAVGLFEKPDVVNQVVLEIENLGFPRKEVRTLEEPATFDITGVTSFPRLDFEVDLMRELTRIGATKAEAEAYVGGLRRGGALVFATGLDDKVDAAAGVMSQHGAIEVETASGPEPQLPRVTRSRPATKRHSQVMTGRLRETGGGPRLFVW